MKWLEWTTRNFRNTPEAEPTKLPKGTSVSFVSSVSSDFPKSQLEESMHRLEAARVLIAVCDDGEDVRILQTDADQAALDGFTSYSPGDIYAYVILGEGERKMLHSFKRTFGGAIEWRLP